MNSDFLEHFSLREFAIWAAIYTLLAFTSSGSKSAMVFSRRNVVPASTIFSEHFKFLTILVVLTWIATALYSRLPAWSKEEWFSARGGRFSGIDLGFILAMAIMYLFERRRIYRETDTESEATQ